MDITIFIYIVAAASVGIILGLIIGYLLAIKKSVDAEGRATRFETMSNGFHKQMAEKDVEISRLNVQVERNQSELLAAEAAKTQAETKLTEVNADLVELRDELEAKELERISYRNSHIEAEKKSVGLDATNKAILQQLAEQKQFLEDANEKLRDAFSSLSSEALRKNNTSFIELANEKLNEKVTESATELEKRKQAIDSLVKPLGESLSKFDQKLGEIELKREGAYAGMTELVTAMKSTTDRLDLGTKQLVTALKTSHVRGRYGEIALKRLVEAAGLTQYCDFTEQDTVTTEDGRLRPDMTVHLPGHRQLILDSKVPLASYLRTFETDIETEQAAHLKAHALAVRDHVKKLGHKSYWEQFAEAPDFVIMYLHLESSYGAALMSDPDLILEALNHNIVFATPSTLIGMLRTVGYMWQQEKMAEDILEMRDAGLELYRRTAKMLDHFSKVGTGLNTAVNSFNDAVGSIETRVIPHLVKIKEIGGPRAKDDLPVLKHVETAIRPIVKSLNSGEEQI